MFKKKLLFKVEESDVVNFCRILGKYGLKFKVSQARSVPRKDGSNLCWYYRAFAVYASSRQARALYADLNGDDESVFDS